MKRSTIAAFVAIAATLVCGGFVAWVGYSFSAGVEPEMVSGWTAIFWIAVGLASTCGYWLAPLAFGTSSAALMFRLVALVLQLPTVLVFASLLPHQFRGLGRGAIPSVEALAVGIFALAASAYLVFALLSFANESADAAVEGARKESP